MFHCRSRYIGLNTFPSITTSASQYSTLDYTLSGYQSSYFIQHVQMATDWGLGGLPTFVQRSHADVYPAIDPTSIKLPQPSIVCVVGASRGIGAGIATPALYWHLDGSLASKQPPQAARNSTQTSRSRSWSVTLHPLLPFPSLPKGSKPGLADWMLWWSTLECPVPSSRN